MTTASALDGSRELGRLVGEERKILVEFVVRLADFNRLKCWATLGYRSPWDFLRRELGRSEALASDRLTAAFLVARFPQIIELLRDGRLCITNLIKLRDVLTAENCDQVLAQACGRPKREVEMIVAAYLPQPAPRDRIEPLAPALHRLQVTVSDQFVGDLDEARAA